VRSGPMGPAGAQASGRVDARPGRLGRAAVAEWSRPALDRVRVVGDHIRLLPPPPHVQIGDKVVRQVLAWGEGGQRGLATAEVAVIGVGGTGSQITVQLAHLGVGALILVDPDRVEASNLSRLVGAVQGDIGRPKVEVLADAARAINPSAAVQAVPASVLDVDPALLAMADVVVCATDGHGSRALLTELAQQYSSRSSTSASRLCPVRVAPAAGCGCCGRAAGACTAPGRWTRAWSARNTSTTKSEPASLNAATFEAPTSPRPR
jgi:molybdopterin-synthase adenylyltransferase